MRNVTYVVSRLLQISKLYPEMEFLVKIKNGLAQVGVPKGHEGDIVEQLLNAEEDGIVGEVYTDA